MAQGIDGATATTPLDVVRAMLAMQAQDLPGAMWSIGLRSPGTTSAAVHLSLNRAEIVRSWPMRGTLHLTAAEDLGWMLALTGKRTLRSLATRHRQLGIDGDAARGAGEVAAAVIAGRGGATRAELFAAFEQRGISTVGQRGVHLLGRLCHTGLLCQGPMRDGEQLFVLMHEWIVQPRRLTGEEALAEFVLRYFTGHGPATLADFCRWTKLPLTDARTGLAAVRYRLEELAVDDTTMWMRPGLRDVCAGTTYLLPGFDELILGYADRSATLPERYAGAIVPGNNGVFQPTVVADGRVVGIWRRKRTAAGVTVTPGLFEPLPARHRSGLQDAAERYAAFLGVDVRLR